MAEKKYVGSEALIRLVAQLKAGFASLTHKHNISDLEDYKVDDALSSTSTNPVQNQALKSKFDEVEVKIDAVTSGATPVAEATHSSKADSATHATTAYSATNAENADHATTADKAAHAVSSDTATIAGSAINDGNGNVISQTYETIENADAREAELTAAIESLASGDTPVAKADHATTAGSATSATFASQADSANTALNANYSYEAGEAVTATSDGSGRVIVDTYETKVDAASKLVEAKSYADSAAAAVKDDLLNGAGGAYDTLKELGDLIDVNVDAIDALEVIAANKADAEHSHDDVYYTETEIDSKIAALESGIASKSDSTHAHSNATVTSAGFMSAADKEKLESISAGANAYTLPSAGTSLGGVKTGGDVTIKDGVITINDNSHTHTVGEVDGLQSVLDGKADSSHNHDDRYYTEAEIDSKISAIDSELSGKALSSHSHEVGEVTGLQVALDGKADVSHSHAIANVSGLQDELNAINAQFVAIDNATIDSICGTSIVVATSDAASEVTF